MMANPEYQKKMKEMTKDKKFQEGIKKTTDMLKDPNSAAQQEAKMEHMLKVGEETLKKNAGDQMKEAMAAMNNPDVMAEMQQMMKDPKFMQQIQAMTKDPNFQSYVDAVRKNLDLREFHDERSGKVALHSYIDLTWLVSIDTWPLQVQDMVKDPAMKAKLEQVGQQVKKGL